MSNTASEKMLEVVSIVKENASCAEKEYDRKAEELQRMARRSIDLFGGEANGQVADIVSESKKICDTLYATYQRLVKMLDEQCRPLLDEEPDFQAVSAVYNLIKRLNDESEIENNFTASLNGRNLGGVASGRYFPTIENKMIQGFWEVKYSTSPGKADEEEKERCKKEDKRRKIEEMLDRRLQEEENEYKEKLAAYEEKHAEWLQKADEIRKQRIEEIERSLAIAKETYIKEYQETYIKDVQQITEETDEYTKKKTAAETELASLGMFKFSEKKEVKKVIDEMSAKIADASKRRNTAETTYQNQKNELDSWVNNKKCQIQNEVEEKYPLPVEPRKPFYMGTTKMTAMQRENEITKYIIVEEMVPNKQYTIGELICSIPELNDSSEMRVGALLRQLVDERRVSRTADRNHYFIESK